MTPVGCISGPGSDPGWYTFPLNFSLAFDVGLGSNFVICVVVPQWEVGRVANDAVPPPRDGVGRDLDYNTKVLRVLLLVFT